MFALRGREQFAGPFSAEQSFGYGRQQRPQFIVGPEDACGSEDVPQPHRLDGNRCLDGLRFGIGRSPPQVGGIQRDDRRWRATPRRTVPYLPGVLRRMGNLDRAGRWFGAGEPAKIDAFIVDKEFVLSCKRPNDEVPAGVDSSCRAGAG